MVVARSWAGYSLITPIATFVVQPIPSRATISEYLAITMLGYFTNRCTMKIRRNDGGEVVHRHQNGAKCHRRPHVKGSKAVKHAEELNVCKLLLNGALCRPSSRATLLGCIRRGGAKLLEC